MGNVMPLAITGAGFAAAGALLTLFFRWLIGDDRRAMRAILRGPEVVAQVVGVTEHVGDEDPLYGGGGGGFAPVVTFQTVDGQSVTAGSQYIFAPRKRVPAVGEMMRVRYQPGDPGRIYIRGWDKASRGLWVLVAVGPLLVLVGALMMVAAFVFA